MSEEPNLPPIPDIGQILYRKERYIEKKYTVIKCDKCQAKNSRSFEPGDYTFKKLENEECQECHRKGSTIVEIYSEWIDPKKKRKRQAKKEKKKSEKEKRKSEKEKRKSEKEKKKREKET